MDKIIFATQNRPNLVYMNLNTRILKVELLLFPLIFILLLYFTIEAVCQVGFIEKIKKLSFYGLKIHISFKNYLPFRIKAFLSK